MQRFDVHQEDPLGRETAFHWALRGVTVRQSRMALTSQASSHASLATVPTITRLLDAGANPNRPDSRGHHPVHGLISEVLQGTLPATVLKTWAFDPRWD